MSGWIPVTESLPDDLVTVLVSDTKTVGISEYHYGLAEWLYCEVVVDEVTHWQPIVYPDAP